MAWDDEMVAIVRGLMQDYEDPETGDPPKYTDDRLATLVLIAAQNVQARVLLPQRYEISVPNGTIKPDPTSKATRSESFINLTTLKAACIIANAEIREYTGQGISVRDGSSAVSLQRSPAALGLLQKTYCTEYESAVYTLQITGVMDGLGEAVVGPIKAWYWGGGRSEEPNYGMYPGPSRIGRGGSTGTDWWGN